MMNIQNQIWELVYSKTVVYSFSPKQRLRFLDVNEKIEMAEYFQIEPRSVRMVQTLY